MAAPSYAVVLGLSAFVVSYSNVGFLLGEESFQEGVDAKESKGLLLWLCRVLLEIAAQND